MVSSLIPPKKEGKNNDIIKTASHATQHEATRCFKRAVKRLLNPRVWHEIAGTWSAAVKLYSADGREAEKLATIGDLYRIDIPGPGPEGGGGYDWVKVDAIEDFTNSEAKEELFAMRLRPAGSPDKETNDTAHFFNAYSSSTFVIHREGNTVTASYHGRNEVPNNETSNTINNIRNSLFAAGAIAGLSELQWNALTAGLLEDELGDK